VPATVAEIVSRLLAREPSDRIQSAEAVVWALRKSAASDRAGPLSVLIVDDDQDAWEHVAAAVRAVAPEASIEAVPDAETALARLSVRLPDVILLDLVLPLMSGVELAMWIRSEPALAAARVVVLSAAATDGDRALLRQLGVTRFVDKGMSLGSGLAEAVGEIRRLVAPAARAGAR
jgi:CheY-like chemotaxis protein